jgi:integrase
VEGKQTSLGVKGLDNEADAYNSWYRLMAGVMEKVALLKEHKSAHKGKSRTIYFCPEAVAVLLEQKAKYGSGFLFRSRFELPWTKTALVSAMNRLQRKLGVKATAYGYRHTFATEALANGVPDAQVAALLGHSGTAMLHKYYSHLTGQARALREALGKVR